MFTHRHILPSVESSPAPSNKPYLGEQAKTLLRTVAPTKEEKATRPMSKLAYKGTSTIKKKLNFDDSFNFDPPTIPRQKCQLAELQAEVTELRMKLASKSREFDRTSCVNQELNMEVNEMRNKITQLRQDLVAKEEEFRANASIQETSVLNSSQMNDDIRDAAVKFFNWFNLAMEQLRVAERILRSNRLWTTANKRQLLAAQRSCPLEMTEEDILDMAQGSVQEFPGLEDLDKEEEEEVEYNRMNDQSIAGNTFLHETTARSTKFVPPSPIGEASAEEHNTSATSLLESSILVEKDEKISALEQKNALLLDRLKIYSSRAQEALLLQEHKRSLEDRVKMLEQARDKALSETAALRAATANGMFNDIADAESHAKALQYADRIKQMEIRNKELMSDLSQAEEHCQDRDRLRSTLSTREATVQHLQRQLDLANQKLDEADAEVAQLEAQKRELSGALEAKKLEIVDLEKRLSAEIATAALALPVAALPTDAGDTTQIVHMVNNPLQMAHDEMRQREELSRKRKASGSLDDDVEAKRSREELDLLREALAKAERERSSMKTVYEDTLTNMKKFRQITTVLTGCQIKVTNFEEGAVTVSSIYDEAKKELAFKYHADTTGVDLLETEQATVWEEEARRYIGERQSVPAFLASVTLRLEADREMPEEEEEVERTHMVSVMHQD